jgi:long-chain acyl-CoA synthetase
VLRRVVGERGAQRTARHCRSRTHGLKAITLTEYRTIAALAAELGDTDGDPTAVMRRDGDGWSEQSYSELAGEVRGVARGLVDLGMEPGDRFCILGETRPEWTYADLGAAMAGATVVPIYATNAPEECEWVIGNSGARAVLCENAAQVAKVERVRANLPDLEHVLVIDADDCPSGVTPLRELASGGGDDTEIERRAAAVKPEDPCTIVYTSGTTGPPKGCVLTHRNFGYICQSVRETKVIRPADRVYLYLPLAHVFARIVQTANFEVGATLVYFGGNVAALLAELGEVHPHYLPSVPRIFEKLYAAAQSAPDLDTEQRGEIARSLFGGELRQATSGAAPIAPEILEFFDEAGVPVLEGYGLTETTGVATISTIEEHRFGTVGRALPGIDLRIADDGEIVMRGPNIFQGYYGNDDATRDVLVDGWFHTGDIGEIDDDGYLKITGRKKDLIITAGGKNISPANLENDLKQAPLISQAVVYGDRRPYLVALVTLDPDAAQQFANEHGLPADLATLSRHPKVLAAVQAILDDVNSRYARVEQIKRFEVLDHDFTQEQGHVTPTMKLKRNVVNEEYAEVFDRLYEGSDAS